MKIDKSDAFLIHSVLFAYSNSDVTFSEEDAQHLEELQTRLRDFVLGNEESCEDEDCDHDHDDSDEYEEEEDDVEEEEDLDEEDDIPIEFYVSPKAAAELSPMKVTAPDGSTVQLEFEDVGEADTIDVLIDDGAIIIDSVDKVIITKGTASFFDGEQWHPFRVERLPKAWKKTFELDKVAGFRSEE